MSEGRATAPHELRCRLMNSHPHESPIHAPRHFQPRTWGFVCSLTTILSMSSPLSAVGWMSTRRRSRIGSTEAEGPSCRLARSSPSCLAPTPGPRAPPCASFDAAIRRHERKPSARCHFYGALFFAPRTTLRSAGEYLNGELLSDNQTQSILVVKITGRGMWKPLLSPPLGNGGGRAVGQCEYLFKGSAADTTRGPSSTLTQDSLSGSVLGAWGVRVRCRPRRRSCDFRLLVLTSS